MVTVWTVIVGGVVVGGVVVGGVVVGGVVVGGVVVGGVVVGGVVVGGGSPQLTSYVETAVWPPGHTAYSASEPDVPFSAAVTNERSAVAVPVPTKFGGLSTAGTFWNSPPSTDTSNEIGWSPCANDQKVALAVVQSALTTSPECANAELVKANVDDTTSARIVKTMTRTRIGSLRRRGADRASGLHP